ncbi:MAG: universal stress protein [Acholeplasmataceae bacterium]|nr:universal stress protein [Acholeplasmataceae bacterium]
MLKKVLVLVDGAENSFRALNYAIELCKLSAGELIVMTSVKTEMKVTAEAAPLDQELRTQANNEAVKTGNKALGSAKAVLDGSGISVQYILEFGSPAAMAMKTVEKFECDTIVVGSRGLGTIKGILSDSVSTKLVQDAHIPVIVIK